MNEVVIFFVLMVVSLVVTQKDWIIQTMNNMFFNNVNRSFSINPIDKETQVEMWSKLKPVLETAEEKRKSFVTAFSLLASVMVFTLILTTYYGIPYAKELDQEGNDNGFDLLFLLYFAQLMLPSLPIYLYKQFYKKNIIPIIGERLGYQYDIHGKTAWPLLEEKEGSLNIKGAVSLSKNMLFGSYSDEDHEDGFIGTYNGKTVAFEEVKLTKGSDKSKRVVFKGLLMAMDAPKVAEAPVLLRRDAGNKLFRFMSERKLFGMEKVELEDVHFEKEFDVYSTDQIKSRTILTPRFMERLKGISRHYNAPVTAAFYEEKVFIAVHTNKNFFEPASIFTDARTRHNVDAILAQIALQHQVIDSLE